MCLWVYQDFYCGHQTLFHVDDCADAIAGLDCKTARKETSPCVGPSAYLCRRCYTVQSPGVDSKLPPLTRPQEEKVAKHQTAASHAISDVPEVSYWSDSSSSETGSLYSTQSVQTEKETNSDHDDPSDRSSYTSAGSHIGLSRPVPHREIHAYILAWQQGVVMRTTIDPAQPQDASGYKSKLLQSHLPREVSLHLHLLHLAAGRATASDHSRTQCTETRCNEDVSLNGNMSGNRKPKG